MKVTVYMKSGNQLVQRAVRDYSVKNIGDEITGLEIKLHWWGKRTLLVGTVALSQIEAVSVE